MITLLRRLALILGAVMLCATPGAAVNTSETPRLHVQTAADWRERGALTGGSLQLRPGQVSGTLESPELPGEFVELLPSWNALTPPGSWLELEVRARVGQRWTRYYSFGRWSAHDEPRRASRSGQRDADGEVLTDLLRLARPASAYQYRLRLSAAPGGASPGVRRLTFTLSSGAPRPASAQAERSAAWGVVLPVPAVSQLVYPGGVNYCSPAAISMLAAYWGRAVSVPRAVAGTFDHGYGGTGNWAFNVAYAGTLGFTAYVTRLGGVRDLERHILAGVPVALSLGWKEGELPGSFLAKSAGHLIVVAGFDGAGNVVVNDPYAPGDAQVRRTYPRSLLERLWLAHSGGVVYVLVPQEREELLERLS